MLKLKIVKGPDRLGEKWKLGKNQTFTVGRGESSDIKLTKGGVSKRHCTLKWISDSEVEIEDLGSSNGTFVNGVLIKKHICVLGDVVRISTYEIKISSEAVSAPKKALKMNFESSRPAAGTTLTQGNLAFKPDAWATPTNLPEVESAQETPAASTPQTFAEKVAAFLDRAVYPIADSLSASMNVRTLLFIVLGLWSIILIVLTAYPFMDKANERVQTQALQVARLYARQLVRVNQRAVVEQRYGDLVGTLDARSGQTPGLVDSMVIDNQKATILAPAEKLGSPLPSTFAGKAISNEKEFIALEGGGIAHVGIPIFIGTSEGNKAVATAYVVFNIERAVFNTANLLDQISSSLLMGLIVGLLLFVFAFRWIEGSIKTLTQNVTSILRNPTTEVRVPVLWEPINDLSTEISALQLKLSQTGSQSQSNSMGTSSGEWLTEFCMLSPIASAIMDSSQKITNWNSAMETLTGIREGQAVGADISNASRDLAFETAIKELCNDATNQPGTTAKRELDFSGTTHKINVVFTGSQYLITIFKDQGA
jgi:hypothetical protein